MPQITGHLETLYFTSFKTDFGWIRPISNGQSLIRLDWNQTGWDDLAIIRTMFHVKQKVSLKLFSPAIFANLTFRLPPLAKAQLAKNGLR